MNFAKRAETCRDLGNVHLNYSCSLLTSETHWYRSSSVRVILQNGTCFFNTRTKQKVCVWVILDTFKKNHWKKLVLLNFLANIKN